MRRLSLAIALISISACSVGPDIDGSLTLGLMPGTDTNPTTDATVGTTDGESSADGASSDDAPAPPTCSNGAQGEDETDVDCGGSCPACDDGQGCMVAADCSSGVCTDGVCVAASCGNGAVDAGEECDAGMATATCDVDCTAPACGDGVLNIPAGETCDTGGESATCNTDCTAAGCGDGVLNVTAGETCDTGGESAACNVDCTAAACGDGMLNVTAGEACDQGGNTATCDADCTAVLCGDGSLNPMAGEACDDGGETAACDLDCTAATCGDGTVNGAAGEECDGGPAGECGADCLFAGCLPDPVALALAACTAAYPSCDIVGGGVVGYGGGSCTGCNCGLPADPWRFYCTMTSDASNYNCSACTVGEILGPHNPCNCDPGTSPVLGTFCT